MSNEQLLIAPVIAIVIAPEEVLSHIPHACGCFRRQKAEGTSRARGEG